MDIGFHLAQHLGVELLSSMGNMYLTLWVTTKCFLKWLYTMVVLLAVFENFSCATSLLSLGVGTYSNFSHFSAGVVVIVILFCISLMTVMLSTCCRATGQYICLWLWSVCLNLLPNVNWGLRVYFLKSPGCKSFVNIVNIFSQVVACIFNIIKCIVEKAKVVSFDEVQFITILFLGLCFLRPI